MGRIIPIEVLSCERLDMAGIMDASGDICQAGEVVPFTTESGSRPGILKAAALVRIGEWIRGICLPICPAARHFSKKGSIDTTVFDSSCMKGEGIANVCIAFAILSAIGDFSASRMWSCQEKAPLTMLCTSRMVSEKVTA